MSIEERTNDIEIKQKILKENEACHDVCAKYHTRAVPYQSRNSTKKYVWKLIIQQLKKYNVNPKNAKVLEIACGTGTFVKLFQKLNSASYTGIDISGEMIKIAKENHNCKNVSFEKISLEEYVKNHQNEYDIIISSSFLHHLYDLEEGVLEINSLLKPNGIYIALHEVICNRKKTKLEKFDSQLSCLLGYHGNIKFSFFERLKKFLNYILYNNPIIKPQTYPNKKVFKFLHIPLWKIKYKDSYKKHYFLSFLPLFKTKECIKENVKKNNKQTNYVDYQLNFNFDLETNETIKQYGEVIPYCYYSIIEFMYIKKVNNHTMFVMVKK